MMLKISSSTSFTGLVAGLWFSPPISTVSITVSLTIIVVGITFNNVHSFCMDKRWDV